MDEAEAHEVRRRRRHFIRTHHPDRGGDPDAFVAGLRSFAAEPEPEPLPRVTVVRRRRWPARLVITAADRIQRGKKPPRVR